MSSLIMFMMEMMTMMRLILRTIQISHCVLPDEDEKEDEDDELDSEEGVSMFTVISLWL